MRSSSSEIHTGDFTSDISVLMKFGDAAGVSSSSESLIIEKAGLSFITTFSVITEENVTYSYVGRDVYPTLSE